MELTDKQKQALEKLDKEMEQATSPCAKYIAEQLIQLVTNCPDMAKKVLEEKKNLAGALAQVTNVAKKRATAGCACIDNEEVLSIAYKYYDLDENMPSSASELSQALGNSAEKLTQNVDADEAVSVNLDDFF